MQLATQVFFEDRCREFLSWNWRWDPPWKKLQSENHVWNKQFWFVLLSVLDFSYDSDANTRPSFSLVLRLIFFKSPESMAVRDTEKNWDHSHNHFYMLIWMSTNFRADASHPQQDSIKALSWWDHQWHCDKRSTGVTERSRVHPNIILGVPVARGARLAPNSDWLVVMRRFVLNRNARCWQIYFCVGIIHAHSNSDCAWKALGKVL